MEHIPITESDIEKVCRIASELGIGIEEAAITCDAFELAFSEDGLRRAIFGLIDELDDEAYKKGEPLGMILSYAVELGMDGIHVSRHANDIPPGQVVSLTPTNRAMIFLKIKDNFPTQQFLGPLIVNRPDLGPEDQCSVEQSDLISDFNQLPSLDKEGWQTDAFCRADGVVRSDTEITEPDIPTELPSRSTKAVIHLGPIRLKLNERFPFLSPAASKSQPGSFVRSADRAALNPQHHLPPWAALQAGMPAVQSASGLSPPLAVGDRGHSASKDVPRPSAITVET